MKVTTQNTIKAVAICFCLFLIYKVGINGQIASATSSSLTGKCALISNRNSSGFDAFCAANSGACNTSVNALTLLDFDLGRYQYTATAINEFATSNTATTQFIGSGTFTTVANTPFSGYHQLTLDTGEIHHCVQVNSGNTLLCLMSVSGESLTNSGDTPTVITHTPAQSSICQKV